MPTPTPRQAYFGNPASPGYEPRKADIVRVLERIEVQAALNGTLYFEDTLAQLNAVSSPATGSTGFVLANGGNNGVYLRGASSWTKTAELPAAFSDALSALAALAAEEAARESADNLGDTIRLESIGGTGNAITAAIPAAQSHIAMSVGQVVTWRQGAENTGAVTLTVGGTTYAVRSHGGPALPEGALKANYQYTGVVYATGGSALIRLQNAVVPSDAGAAAEGHTHTASQISDSSATGRALVQAATQAAARTALGLGSAATSDASAFATGAQGALAGSSVQLTGAQTIAGVKTFSSAPVVPDAAFGIAKVSGLQTALDGKSPALAANGIYVRNGAGSAVARQIEVGPGLTITNPTGVNGNPLVAFGPATETAILAALSAVQPAQLQAAEQRAGGQAIRPGEAPSAFVLNSIGAPGTLGSIAGVAGITSEAVPGLGVAAVVDSLAAVIASNSVWPVQPGRVYRVHGYVQRLGDGTDPSGNTVRLGLRRLDASYANLGFVVVEDKTLRIADGRYHFDATFMVNPGALADVDIPLTAGTVYVRPYVQLYTGDHRTAVAQLEIRDVTEAALIDGALDVVALADAVEDAGAAASATALDRIQTGLDREVSTQAALDAVEAAASIQPYTNLSAAVAGIPLLDPVITTIAYYQAGEIVRLYRKPGSTEVPGALGWAFADVPTTPLFGKRQGIVALGTGQSNMLGGAATGGDQAVNNRVFAWNGTAWVVAEMGVAPFGVSGNNLLWNAGKILQETTGNDVYLILVAQGGQAIERWEADDATPTLWNRIVTDVPAALAAIGRTTVDRVLWHQGEANNAMGCFIYRGKLIKVKNQMRALSWWRDGHTYMMAGEMVQSTLNNSQAQTLGARLASEIDDDITVVSSFGLEPNPGDDIHFSGAGLVDYGKRFGRSALSHYGAHKTFAAARDCPGSGALFSIMQDGSGDFDNIPDAVRFLSMLQFPSGGRAIVTIGPGQWDIPLGLRCDGLQHCEFSGTLAGGFVQPLKTDFTGVKATDLAYLRGLYLTEILCTTHGLMGNGGNGGAWRNMLISTATPAVGTHGVRTDDANLLRNEQHGSFWLENVVVFGFDASENNALQASNGGAIQCANVIVAHCFRGILAVQRGSAQANGIIFAYTASQEVFASGGGTDVSVFGAKVQAPTAVVYQAVDCATINARTADSNTLIAEIRGGDVIT